MATEGGEPTTRVPLRRRLPIIALLGGNVVSLVGSMLSLVALPWFVLQTTGSPAKAGLVGFARLLPAFAAGIVGGTLVDRFGYKPVSILTDLISGLAIAMIPLLYHTGGLALWQLLVLVFLAAAPEVPGLTARRSLLPELATHGQVDLERLNAAFESIDNLALLVGPPIAGLLIAQVGASNVLWLDALSFAISAGLVAILVPAASVTTIATRPGSYGDELRAGLRFLRQERLLFPMAIVLGLSNALSGPMVGVVLPVYVQEVFGRAPVLGLLVAALGAGAFLGATLYGSVGQRLPRRLLWFGSFLIVPAEYWALSLAPPLAVLVVVLAIVGVATGPTNPLMVTIRHERIPPPLRGRVFSTYSAIALAAQPLGMVVAGALLQGLGLTPAVLVLATAAQSLALAMFFVPAFRAMQRPQRPRRPR